MNTHQRQGYAPTSPPLHHPVPQHVSSVPQLRSPPPAQGFGSPYAPQMQQAHADYGGLLNETTASMGLHMGQQAFSTGQAYMEQNFNRFVNVSALKHYFDVSNGYVLHKLYLVLFPWRHKPWSRHVQYHDAGGQGSQTSQQYASPRIDTNAPDMYIPFMAIVTYILLSASLQGLQGKFEPEVLGGSASTALLVVAAEIGLLKLGCYFLGVTNDSQLLDLIAYSGYKFVGVDITMLSTSLLGLRHTWFSWLIFTYVFAANAFFLLRSLKYVLLEGTADASRGTVYAAAKSKKQQRSHFLFLYSYVLQFGLMFFLSL